MKTIAVTMITFFLASTIYANELSWVDEQIEAIKPPRKSVRILSINNPFVFIGEKSSTKNSSTKNKSSSKSTKKTSSNTSKKSAKTSLNNSNFILSTIINSSAMINGKWYKLNDTISGFSIIKVSKTSVKLKKGDRQLTLSTNNKKRNLKFKNK